MIQIFFVAPHKNQKTNQQKQNQPQTNQIKNGTNLKPYLVLALKQAQFAHD